jgi:excisionase family DNA binding protein
MAAGNFVEFDFSLGRPDGNWKRIMAARAHSFNEAREVMSLRQASMYLGVSADTMYRYVSEGVVPAFKLGNRWKLRKSVLDRWMERKMSQIRPKRRR